MSDENKYFYRFGDFRLDYREEVLYHLEEVVPLKPKAVLTLIALVENAGKIINKQDLMNRIWQNTFVEENNLSVNIYELRKAFLRFGASDKIIETVSRRGFRFNAEVEKIADSSPKESSLKNGEIQINGGSTGRFNVWKRIPVQILIFGTIIFGGIAGVAFLYGWQSNLKIGQRPQLSDRGTKSIEAYQAYLRGRELWQTRDTAQMEQGIIFFKRAIENDPNFAAPYIGIADSLSMMRDDAGDRRQAEEYIQKARALQPDSADAHASWGFILAMNKWQWRDAEAAFQTALALDENSAKAHQWYATLLQIERRFDEAETHLKRAIEIEPLSPNYNADLCELYYLANRTDQLFRQCRTLHEINPGFPLDNTLTNFYINQRRYDEALKEVIESGLRHGENETQIKNSDWYKAYRKNGFRGWIEANLRSSANRGNSALNYYNQSLSYAQLGDRDRSIELLEKAFAGHAFMVPFANARPEFDFIRDDPRFRELMLKLNLIPDPNS